MLDGEEGGQGLRQLVEQVVRTTGINEVADTGENVFRISENNVEFQKPCAS